MAASQMKFEAASLMGLADRSKLRERLRRYAIHLGIALAILLFFVVFFSPDIFKVIPAGSVGVLYRPLLGGTLTETVMGEGLHAIAPWDALTVYNVRVQEVKHEMHVLTKEGLTITLQLSIRYHPEAEMVGMLHKTIGPEYKTKVVIPEVESAMRTIMATFTVNDVYTSDPGLLQRIIDESLEGVSQKFVRVDDVVLRALELPNKVREAVEEKMKEKQLAEAYEYRIQRERMEGERRQIEADNIKKYNDVLNSSITPQVLKWKAIEATRDLAQSPNSKVILLGGKSNDMPIMLGGDK